MKYLPRIVFYPLAKDIDMEEIDCAFTVEETIDNAPNYFQNFKSRFESKFIFKKKCN